MTPHGSGIKRDLSANRREIVKGTLPKTDVLSDVLFLFRSRFSKNERIIVLFSIIHPDVINF